MIPRRPYLIRAIYEWAVENSLTPHLLVDASVDGVAVPREYVQNNQVILNISPAAVRGLTLGNDGVSFTARFGGEVHDISVPVPAVLAIYARENGEGMMFSEDDYPKPPTSGPPTSSEVSSKPSSTPGKPFLKVVK